MAAPSGSEIFAEEWLSDVQEGSPSTIEVGNRFSRKLLTQWLGISEDVDDLYYCDGTGDGGIDIAYLQRHSEDLDDDTSALGDTWYLVQSKFGSAFRGTSTLLLEGEKVIDTLDGRRLNLTSISQDLLERLKNFRRQASENDRLRLVFATVEPLSSQEKKTLSDIETVGRNRLGGLFDVEDISVATIYERVRDFGYSTQQIRVPIKIQASESSNNLLVGAVSVYNYYQFLKRYHEKTGDLDQLFEKNVRQFLGDKAKVNKQMQYTLRNDPLLFGLYNNGITIVASNYSLSKGNFEVLNPYVVNGCQTTRTIWDVCEQIYGAGGTGKDPAISTWKKQIEQGVFVAKIVKVSREEQALLEDITRYTNSQTGVRSKDFLALVHGFKGYSSEMAQRYDVYLEIQRGGWESHRAFQKQNPTAHRFTKWANAFDLLKVYGAGWYREAGEAQGGNRNFLPPDGKVYKQILDSGQEGAHFGVDDLYASFLLVEMSRTFRFGHQAPLQSRRLTKFLYYMTVLDILASILKRENMGSAAKDLTHAVLKLFTPPNEPIGQELLKRSVELIDEYFSDASDLSVYNEPPVQQSKNPRTYMMLERVGKDDTVSPQYRALFREYERNLFRAESGGLGQRIVAALRE